MPACLGSASPCCVILVQSPALSGLLFLPEEEQSLLALPVEAGDRGLVVVGVDREIPECTPGLVVGDGFWLWEAEFEARDSWRGGVG